MSDSDDKKDNNSDEVKSSGSKPVKHSRKRQASRPPTINVEAVRLETEAAGKTTSAKSKKENSDSADKASAKTPEKSKESAGPKTDADTTDIKSEAAPISQGAGRFGYRALAISAGIGAAASIALFAVTFGVNFFSSGQTALEEKVRALSSKIASLSTLAEKAKISQANSTAITALKQQLEGLKARPDNARFEKLSGRIKFLEAENAKPQKPAIDPAEIKNLGDRLKILAVKTEEAKSAAEKSNDRAALVEKALKSAGESVKGSVEGSRSSLVAQNLRLAGFEAQVKRLSEGLNDLQSKATKNTKIASLEKTVIALRQDAGKLNDRIVTLEALIATANKALAKLEQVDITGNIGRLAALSFALEALVRKVETGGSFESELMAISKALPQNEPLKKLKDHASSGIKSVAQLQHDFLTTLKAILAAKDSPASSGVVGKLVGTAKSLIRIRRVGDIAGDDQEAIIARMEARVKTGDLAMALVAAEKLQGASAKAAEVWVRSVEERVKTIKRVKEIRNDVISNLGSDMGSGNAKPATKE